MFSLFAAGVPPVSLVRSPPIYSLSPEFVKTNSVVFALEASPLRRIMPFCATRNPPSVRVNVPLAVVETLRIFLSPRAFWRVKTPPTVKFATPSSQYTAFKMWLEAEADIRSIVKSPSKLALPLPPIERRVSYQLVELLVSV